MHKGISMQSLRPLFLCETQAPGSVQKPVSSPQTDDKALLLKTILTSHGTQRSPAGAILTSIHGTGRYFLHPTRGER